MEQYMIVKEMKSDIRLFGKITFVDVSILLAFFVVGYSTQTMVAPPLRVIYMIFNVIVGLFCCCNSPTNKGKKMIISLVYSLIRKREVYHSFQEPKQFMIKSSKETQKIFDSLYEDISYIDSIQRESEESENV